jgi:hypothetical protein
MAEELEPWIEWLGSEETNAPVAVAAVRRDGNGLLFYPLADFSPELAAIRWARANGVPVRAFDLPLSLSEGELAGSRLELPTEPFDVLEPLGEMFAADSADELWDRMVEARAPGASAEEVRRAALLIGWAMRLQEAAKVGVSPHDLRREAWMRRRLSETTAGHVVAIVGAFHAPALLQAGGVAVEKEKPTSEVVTSMVPYAFDLLDSRSGYPAGIRDPEWQQAMWSGGATPETAAHATAIFAVAVSRALRLDHHPAGVPDAREVVRFATDIARLRGLPGPARRELVEGLQTCLAQGEPMGRGRAVAKAMQSVLVGGRRGTVATGAPKSGLRPHVEALLASLRLPAPGNEQPQDVRLDPLRSELDRKREIAIQRLRVCGVPYSESIGGDDVTVTRVWRLQWGPATIAMLELAGLRGVTLEQAAAGRLHEVLNQALAKSQVLPRLRLDLLAAAAEASLPEFAWAQADELGGSYLSQASLAEIVEAIEIVGRIAHGHVPGLQPDEKRAAHLDGELIPQLISAAVRQVEGLKGSDREEDARALLALVQRQQAENTVFGDSRLAFALRSLADDGSPLMQGAGGALRVLLGLDTATAFGELVGSWVDAATNREGNRGTWSGRSSRESTGSMTMAFCDGCRRCVKGSR